MLLESFWLTFIQPLWSIFYISMIVICLLLIASHVFSCHAPRYYHNDYALNAQHCRHNFFPTYPNYHTHVHHDDRVHRRDDRVHRHDDRVHRHDDRVHRRDDGVHRRDDGVHVHSRGL